MKRGVSCAKPSGLADSLAKEVERWHNLAGDGAGRRAPCDDQLVVEAFHVKLINTRSHFYKM